MAPADPQWPRQLRQLRAELRSAGLTPHHRLVETALSRYESHHRIRLAYISTDPVRALSAPWATALERAGHWFAGWRPNFLIHILYSEFIMRFESQLQDILEGIHSGDLGDLRPDQMANIDELQRRTVAEEVEISRAMAEVQEGLAGPPIVRNDEELEGKVVGLGGVMRRADELRMRTLRELVVDILEPRQAVDLFVAAADLEIGIRELGIEHERRGVGG